MSGARTDAENNAQTEAQTEETNLEAEYIRENLWFFRLKRGLWPALFVHPLLTEDEYLDIESAKNRFASERCARLRSNIKLPRTASLSRPIIACCWMRRHVGLSTTAIPRSRVASVCNLPAF